MPWAFNQQDYNSSATACRVYTSKAGCGVPAFCSKSENTVTCSLAVTCSNFAYWEIFKHFGSFPNSNTSSPETRITQGRVAALRVWLRFCQPLIWAF